MTKLALALLILAFLPLATLAEDAAPLPFHMPLPEGWRAETIPFPLSFAPELAYEGIEELRFAPGMFDQEAEDYFSYAFVWWVPAETELSAERIARVLETYFRGLTKAVAESRKFDPGSLAHKAEIKEQRDAQGRRAYRGGIATYDAFAARAVVNLEIEAVVIECPEPGRLSVYFALSPQPRPHAVWGALDGIRDGFRCEPWAE